MQQSTECHYSALLVHIFESDNYRKKWSISGKQTLALIVTAEIICDVYSFVKFPFVRCYKLKFIYYTTSEFRLWAFISISILLVI